VRQHESGTAKQVGHADQARDAGGPTERDFYEGIGVQPVAEVRGSETVNRSSPSRSACAARRSVCQASPIAVDTPIPSIAPAPHLAVLVACTIASTRSAGNAFASAPIDTTVRQPLVR
jgi:hypothetical protein